MMGRKTVGLPLGLAPLGVVAIVALAWCGRVKAQSPAAQDPAPAAAVAAPDPADAAPAAMVAFHTRGTIRLDGDLSEPAWKQARHIVSFTQRELDYGKPATERTEVAVVYDDDALYIGFWGYDSDPSGIQASEMARDFDWRGDDNFQIVLDPFHDHRTGYLFVVNPNGARADALLSNGRRNEDWDGVWDVRTRRTPEGWFAEIRIPFSTLRFPTQGSAPWGINFERDIRRLREEVLWQGWSRDYTLETLSRAGAVRDIRGVAGTRPVDARPYASGGMQWQGPDGRSSVQGTGLDVSYLPSPSWKLQVTVHPDFAQVESDVEQVNLSRFSLFYPEKRTFFLEGSQFFDFNLGRDVQPFYSRRIGLSDDRQEIPILAGTRVMGTQGGTTLGAMALRTEAQPGQPATDFGVVRWKQNVLAESSMGAIAIGRHEAGRTAATYGADLRYATSSLFGERSFDASFSEAQTYDSESARHFGLAQRLFVEYPNDRVVIQAGWARVDSAFDPPVGYARRLGFQLYQGRLEFHPRPSWLPLVKQLEIKPFSTDWYVGQGTGRLQSEKTEIIPLGITFKSGDRFEFNIQRNAERPDAPFELIPGVEVPVGTYWWSRWEVQLGSFPGRRLSGSMEINEGGFYLGRRLEATWRGRWKVDRHVAVSGTYVHNRITFGDQRYPVNQAIGRLDLALSPRLFGAVAGQWNNEDQQVIFNFRLNWIPQPGSDLYLVVNQSADTRDLFWAPTATTVLSKLVWRIAF